MSPPPSVISACMPSSSSSILQHRRLDTVKLFRRPSGSTLWRWLVRQPLTVIRAQHNMAVTMLTEQYHERTFSTVYSLLPPEGWRSVRTLHVLLRR